MFSGRGLLVARQSKALGYVALPFVFSPDNVARMRATGSFAEAALLKHPRPQTDMTVVERRELRERTHLEIAISAAIAAGLARNEAEARKNMDRIIELHAFELKARWLRERGGGIKGWLYFLRSFGFEEHLVVRRVDVASAARSSASLEPSTFTE